MSLVCGCGDLDYDWDPDPGQWWYLGNPLPDGYSTYPFKRGRKCISCSHPIKSGQLAVEHPRVKCPGSEVEERIYGEDGEIPIAPHWMCENCGDIYFSLLEIGYCVWPQDNMNKLLAEHHGMKAADKLNFKERY